MIDASTDPHALLEQLADRVVRTLPSAEQAIEIERERSLGDRIAGRAGQVALLRVTRGDTAMTLRLDRGRLTAESARVVGGVVISRRTLTVGAWLAALAGHVAVLAADQAGDAAASAAALAGLGIRAAGADLAVSDANVLNDLEALPVRLTGRLPDAALEAVQRITALLREALPRVTGRAEEEVLVRRTATRYLPETLRAYLALPADWAVSHRLSNGLTAADSLLVQLTDLESAATRMRDAAVAQDAQALLINGRFLADRFALSELDLPG